MTQITYHAVANVCNQLHLLGEKPSTRKIRERLGGSFTTITEHLRQWRNEATLAESTDMALSAELTNSILAEFAMVAQRTESFMKSVFEEKDIDLKETQVALSECEIKFIKLELQFDELKTKAHNDNLELEKKLAFHESTVSFLKEREVELQNKLAATNDAYTQAQLQAAIANTHVDNLKERINELQKKPVSKQ